MRIVLSVLATRSNSSQLVVCAEAKFHAWCCEVVMKDNLGVRERFINTI